MISPFVFVFCLLRVSKLIFQSSLPRFLRILANDFQKKTTKKPLRILKAFEFLLLNKLGSIRKNLK